MKKFTAVENLAKYAELEKPATSILKHEENTRKKFKIFEGKHFVWNLIE